MPKKPTPKPTKKQLKTDKAQAKKKEQKAIATKSASKRDQKSVSKKDQAPKKNSTKDQSKQKKADTKKQQDDLKAKKDESKNKVSTKKDQPKKKADSKKKDQPKVIAPTTDKKDLKRSASKSLDAPEPTKKVKVDDDDKKQIVKVITKGGAAVDALVLNKDDYRVFQEGGKIYSATLNQSNLDANNNKFYIIQILQNEKTNAIYVWNRWGRVGVPGQNALKGPMDKNSAINDYQNKLRDKTVKGDYKELQIKFDDEQQQKKQTKNQKKKQLKTGTSKMHQSIQKFINLIFDTNIMNTTMKQIGYDAKKMPLGKLGDSTIKQAYSVLTKLTKAIKNKNFQQIKTLSSDFYTLIPHDFGFQKMINFILDNDEKVKTKIRMLEAISDMKITTKLLESQNSEDDVVDQNYKKLNCQISAVEKNTNQYKILHQYLHNTKQSWSIQIQDIFKIHRDVEDKVFNQKLGNRMLLWHGSRITNFVGILSQGLRIAPPQAPVSGYLFGKGIYLADMIDKSAHYCRSYGSDTALVLLIEGAIGKPNILLNSSYEAKEQMVKNGKDSTKCHGRIAPPESSYVKLDGITVPKGKAVETKSGSYMGHNEYILYNVNQARIRYVIRMKMK